MKNYPKIKGAPKLLYSLKYGRTALLQKFTNPRTKIDEEFIIFHGANMCHFIMPVTKDGKVVVIKQFRYGIATLQSKHKISPVIYEFPGGHSENGETPKETVQRELLEESGYDGKIINLSSRVFVDPAVNTTHYGAWLALDCKLASKIKLDHAEFIKIILMPLKKWFEMIYAGKITDARSMAISLMALPILKKKNLYKN